MAKLPHFARNMNGQRTFITDYPVKAAETIAIGDFVKLDSNNQIVRVTGADPTLILGIARSHTSTAAREEAIDPTRILVEHFDDTSLVWMEGSSDPVAANKGAQYGLVIDGGTGKTHYKLDISDTTNKRMLVVDIDIPRKAFFCLLLAENRQLLQNVHTVDT